jgi:hypothetical protein
MLQTVGEVPRSARMTKAPAGLAHPKSSRTFAASSNSRSVFGVRHSSGVFVVAGIGNAAFHPILSNLAGINDPGYNLSRNHEITV